MENFLIKCFKEVEDTRQQRQVEVELHPLTSVLVEVIIFVSFMRSLTVF